MLQKEYLKSLIDNDDKIYILNEYIKKVGEMITKIKFEDIVNSINFYESNIFIEYFIKQLITEGEIKYFQKNINEIYFYIVFYHNKFYELIMNNKTLKEYDDIRHDLLTILENKKDMIKEAQYNKLFNIFSMEIHKDNITALEYCYFLSWASFNPKTVNIPKKTIIEHNINDILTINATYNLKFDESIIMYNKIDEIISPTLTKELIEQTKRYNHYPIKEHAKEPVSIYDKEFKKIKELKTNEITVLIDYGNGYYTQLYKDGNPINIKFAKDIQNRVIKCSANKKLLFDIDNKDLFNYLPSECYHEKLDKELLITSLDIMKRIVIESFNAENKQQTINNILKHPSLKTILKNEEKDIFKLYLNYIPMLDIYEVKEIERYCCNYLYEDILNSEIINN